LATAPENGARTVLGELRLRLLQRRPRPLQLERVALRIDTRKHLALAHEVAFLNVDLRHRAFHLRREQRAREGLRLPGRGHAHHQRLAQHRRSAHRNGDLGAERLGRLDLRMFLARRGGGTWLVLRLQGAQSQVDPAQDSTEHDHGHFRWLSIKSELTFLDAPGTPGVAPADSPKACLSTRRQRTALGFPASLHPT